jgi:hypothetical protein
MTDIKINTLVYYWDDDKDDLAQGMVKFLSEKTCLCSVTPMASVEQYAEDQACYLEDVILPEDAPSTVVAIDKVYTDPYACLTGELARLSMEKTIAVKACRKAEKRSTQCSIKIKAVHKVLDQMIEQDDTIG